jgi:hypothetical protein
MESNDPRIVPALRRDPVTFIGGPDDGAVDMLRIEAFATAPETIRRGAATYRRRFGVPIMGSSSIDWIYDHEPS